MYNLTFNNPYNRDIVRKLDGFRNKQQGYFVPTNIEPEHITHQYDPITITGGARVGANGHGIRKIGGDLKSDFTRNLQNFRFGLLQRPDITPDQMMYSIQNSPELTPLALYLRKHPTYTPDVVYKMITQYFTPQQMYQLITGGARMTGGFSSLALSHYPPDLFEPKYTFNRNHMVGNRLQGGASDFQHDTFYQPTTFNSGIANYDSDSDVDDLGKVHANRRGKRVMVGGDFWSDIYKKIPDKLKEPLVYKPNRDVPKEVLDAVNEFKKKKGGKIQHAKGLAPISKDVLEKFKRIKGGKKPKKEKESKPSSKLLKIFN